VVISQCDRIDTDPGAETAHRGLKAALEQAKQAHWYGANVVAEPIDGLGWSDDVRQLPPRRQREVESRHQIAAGAIKAAIEEHLPTVPHLRVAMPRNFFEVKAFVEAAFAASGQEGDGKDVPYFDHVQNRAFLELCKQHRIDTGSVKLYLSLLKSLG